MHPPGESMGSMYRVWNLCQGLSNMSHKCFVFLPFNCFEDWGPYVQFITVPVLSPRGNLSKGFYRFVRKIMNIKFLSNSTILNPIIFDLSMTRISNILLDTIKEKSINLDVFIGETEIGGLILSKIKNELKIPIIVDYQNYWPEELVEHKIIKKNGRRYNYLVEMEKKVLNNTNHTITISHSLKNFLIKKFGREYSPKIKVINNGGIPILNKPKMKVGPPKIINSGMVVQRSNFELFMESMRYLLREYPEAQIYVTKKGEKLKQIMKLAKKMNLNIDFYWKETNKEFIELLSNCHVGVVTSSYNLTRKLGFVAKILDYFSVGIPVVGNDIGGWTSVISEEKVGILSTNDPRDMAEKIIYFIENPEIAYKYGQRAIELLKNKYSVNNSAMELIKCINKTYDNL